MPDKLKLTILKGVFPCKKYICELCSKIAKYVPLGITCFRYCMEVEPFGYCVESLLKELYSLSTLFLNLAQLQRD